MPKTPCPGRETLVETANVELDEEHVRPLAGMIPGAYIVFSMTNTGIGIARKLKSKISIHFLPPRKWAKGRAWGYPPSMGL